MCETVNNLLKVSVFQKLYGLVLSEKFVRVKHDYEKSFCWRYRICVGFSFEGALLKVWRCYEHSGVFRFEWQSQNCNQPERYLKKSDIPNFLAQP